MNSVVRIDSRGLQLARVARVLCQARGSWAEAAQIANAQGLSIARDVCKTVVAAATLDDLVGPQQVVGSDFIEGVRARSAVGRLALRRVPLMTAVITNTSAAIAHWVGERMIIPATSLDLAGQRLDLLKIAAILPLTDETVKSADPAADEFLRRLLIDAAARRIDESFLNPSNSGVVDVSPPSVTFGAPSIPSAGVAKADVRARLSLYQGDYDTAAFVTDPQTSFDLSIALDDENFGARGGDFHGIPIFTTRGSPVDTTGGQVALLDAARIVFADGSATVDRSDAATIELDDSPIGGASAVLVSAWQAGLHLLRLVQYTNWRVVGDGAVAVLTNVSYDD